MMLLEEKLMRYFFPQFLALALALALAPAPALRSVNVSDSSPQYS